MSKVIKSDNENRIFVIEMDMENKSPKEIAKDAGMQILDMQETGTI